MKNPDAPQREAFLRAVAIVGNNNRMAKALGVSAQVVGKWINFTSLPPGRAMQVSILTKNKVKLTELLY